ncbi:MAG: DNA-formamidopyrimidine glycosylase family protein [Chlamydiota bacterium]
MPEIYEVKRIGAYLRRAKIEHQIIAAITFHPGGEKILSPKAAKQLEGQRVMSLMTKAKYTFFELDKGVMVWHYRFTGLPKVAGMSYQGALEAIFQLPVQEKKRFCRLTFTFESGLIIHFLDQRCLSMIRLDAQCQLVSEMREYRALAPDLSEAVMPSYQQWCQKLSRSRRSLKLELQNQMTIPSGIGNYLACEILAYAGLNPWLEAKALTKYEYRKLCQGINEVKAHCESRVDYRWFRVFNRLMCQKCRGPVVKKKQRQSQASQTTHFCPSCQLGLGLRQDVFCVPGGG